MHEALRLVIEVLSRSIAVDEAAADALFTAAFQIGARGAHAEAATILRLSRMHRVKALGLLGQVAVLRTTAARDFQTKL